ncbi:MAG: hypothetical protein IH944_09675 [Armatimonadetes bacterium]|nr:hypothetical protein [Armatimonadota bacterium]
MKFRKLYWVTEQIDGQGRSEVVGVYTSIPDLVEIGLRWDDGLSKRVGYRLSLVKLDSKKKPLGAWQSPDFASLADDLEEFINTKEFSRSECERLVQELSGLIQANGKSDAADAAG